MPDSGRIARRWRPEAEFALTAIAPELWIARYPVVFHGFRMVSCMTVIRLPKNRLWIHSPIAPDTSAARQISTLGRVEWIVAPNRLHHLHALDWAAAHPAAQLFVAPGLAAKNLRLADAPMIPAPCDAPWRDTIDSVFVAGNAELNETVFLHRPTNSLIVTDLAVCLGPWDSFGTRSYARLNGCHGRLGHSFLLKTFFRDRAAARASIEAILAWPFERIILAHGPLIESGAKSAFEAAFSWLLK